MIYAENILICLLMPLAVSLLFIKGSTRRYSAFLLIGMVCSLMAAYCNSFLAGAFSLTAQEAVIKLTPLCEEILKALPILFYVLLFSPKKEHLPAAAIAIGVGFATFENCCYIVQYGAGDIFFLLIRGLAVGTMHTVTTVIIGYGFALAAYDKLYRSVSVLFGLWCAASSYHAVYNILVLGGGTLRIVGYLLPITTVALLLFIRRIFAKRLIGFTL